MRVPTGTASPSSPQSRRRSPSRRPRSGPPRVLDVAGAGRPPRRPRRRPPPAATRARPASPRGAAPPARPRAAAPRPAPAAFEIAVATSSVNSRARPRCRGGSGSVPWSGRPARPRRAPSTTIGLPTEERTRARSRTKRGDRPGHVAPVVDPRGPARLRDRASRVLSPARAATAARPRCRRDALGRHVADGGQHVVRPRSGSSRRASAPSSCRPPR